MATLFALCKTLISKGKMTAEKLDIYYANDRLTTEEYEELVKLLNGND